MTPVNVSEDNLATRVIEALENIKGVLAAIQRGQRVSSDRGEQSLLLFNWLFGGHPYEDEGVLLKAAMQKVEAEREACAKECDKMIALITEDHQCEAPTVNKCSWCGAVTIAAKKIRARSDS